MCGIAGWLGHVDVPEGVEAELLERLRHRGPDGSASRRFEDASLLHTRLRIIDLSPAGDQPMSNEDGSVWTVFNGEIYNHRELQAELERKGHRFRGRSDTEVLPHLYEEYGDAMFERLRGMFALAVLDRPRRRLLLARDRFGIKPLVYAATQPFVAFASELGALRLLPGIDLSPDPQAVADFAALLFVPAPSTIHRGIRALSPGELADCRLLADGTVDVAVRRYHSFAVAPDLELSLEEAADRAEGLVEQAVARQLESDVPLGALLSGGIDSSLVSLFAQRRSEQTLRSFNVRFPDPEYDETDAAIAVAAAIGARHQTLDLNEGGSWERVTALLEHVGQPFADTSLFAVEAISKAMREHVTVALSGDGGDEGFGGYNVYWRIALLNRLRHVPPPLWTLGRGLAEPLARAGIVRPTLARRIHDLSGTDEVGILQTLFSWIREREHAELFQGGHHVKPVRRLFEPRWRHDLPARASRLERLSAHTVEVNFRLTLANDFLPKVDSASMRHSLEVRVPMLDEDLIDFGLTLPHRLRVRGRTGKRVLRAVASRHLPAEVVRRPKQGFAVPVDRWVDAAFSGNLRDRLLDPDAPTGAYLDRRVYEPWVHGFCNGRQLPGISRAGLYQRVMMLLALDLSLART